MNKALFLDRDGVLNQKAPAHQYISSVKDFIWIFGAQDLIQLAKNYGYMVCVITNQQGIGKGLYTLGDVAGIHERMQTDLKRLGSSVDGFYICPHLASDCCECRKPKPGLLKQAIQDFDIDVSQSLLIGDSQTDIKAGESCGIESIRIESNQIKKFLPYIVSLLMKNS